MFEDFFGDYAKKYFVKYFVTDYEDESGRRVVTMPIYTLTSVSGCSCQDWGLSKESEESFRLVRFKEIRPGSDTYRFERIGKGDKWRRVRGSLDHYRASDIITSKDLR